MNKQRSGIGSLLLDQLKCLECFQSGEVQIGPIIEQRPIVVYADLRALKFFEKQGFKKVGQRSERGKELEGKIYRCDKAQLMEYGGQTEEKELPEMIFQHKIFNERHSSDSNSSEHTKSPRTEEKVVEISDEQKTFLKANARLRFRLNEYKKTLSFHKLNQNSCFIAKCKYHGITNDWLGVKESQQTTFKSLDHLYA
jgi:hypothetical protein